MSLYFDVYVSFVLLCYDYTSAMGPFAKLLECGANVVALDIPGKWGSPARPTLWKRLVAEARKSRGSIIFPIRLLMVTFCPFFFLSLLTFPLITIVVTVTPVLFDQSSNVTPPTICSIESLDFSI